MTVMMPKPSNSSKNSLALQQTNNYNVISLVNDQITLLLSPYSPLKGIWGFLCYHSLLSVSVTASLSELFCQSSSVIPTIDSLFNRVTVQVYWPVFCCLFTTTFLGVCVCEFGFNVAFNNFSVISRRCLVATGSSMLTFIVLPHWSIMSQTLDIIPHPVTLSWHWVDQS